MKSSLWNPKLEKIRLKLRCLPMMVFKTVWQWLTEAKILSGESMAVETSLLSKGCLISLYWIHIEFW